MKNNNESIFDKANREILNSKSTKRFTENNQDLEIKSNKIHTNIDNENYLTNKHDINDVNDYKTEKLEKITDKENFDYKMQHLYDIKTMNFYNNANDINDIIKDDNISKISKFSKNNKNDIKYTDLIETKENRNSNIDSNINTKNYDCMNEKELTNNQIRNNPDNNKKLYNYSSNNNEEYDYNTYNDQENDADREAFENDLELIKMVNNLKEENRILKKEQLDSQNQIKDLELNYHEALLKIAELESQLDSNPNNKKSNNNQDSKLLIKANEEIKKLTLQNNKQNVIFEKTKNDLMEENNMLKEKFNNAQSQIDKLVSNEKKIKQELSLKEKKIIKLIEEVERLSNSKSIKKEISNTDKLTNELNAEIKVLEKQNLELQTALKKSLKLISLLKRQKAHLESCRILNISEEKLTQLFLENNI